MQTSNYYLIPLELEDLAAQYVQQWLAQSSESFVCINGYYNQLKASESEETTYTKVIGQDNRFIEKSTVIGDVNGTMTKLDLIFFVLEGKMPQDIEKYALSIGVQKLSYTALQEYIKSLEA